MKDWECIASYGTEAESVVARSFLEAQGIELKVVRSAPADKSKRLFGIGSPRQVELFARADQAAEAREILAAFEDEAEK